MKGYVRKRGDKYSFTVDIGRDPATGKRKQKSKSGFKTKKEAEKALNELINQVNKGTYNDVSKDYVNEYLHEWLELYAKNKLRDTTFANYKRAIDARIIPAIGALKIGELKNHHIQKFVNDLKEEDLSGRYIEYCVTVLHGALEDAIKRDLLVKNPAKHIEIPRERRRQYDTWTSDQIKMFLAYAKIDSPLYYPVFLTALGTGMRRGELLGLTWDHVDFEKKVINVRQSLVYDEKGFRFSEPKTKSSIRSISLDNHLLKELKKHKTKQKELQLLFGGEYNKLNLVFPREAGDPIYPRTLATIFNRITKKANVPKIRLHDLRHTHATLLLEMGVNPKVIAERLGHSSINITLDVYSHVTTSMQEDTVKKIEKIFS